MQDQLIDEDEALECLDGHFEGDDCKGKIELRMALSASGIAYPRCDFHWSERLDTQQGINERYPDHAPSDWSPYDCGESWGDDY